MASPVQSLRAAAASAVLDCGPALSLFSRMPETSSSGPSLVPPPSGPKMHERSSQGGTDQVKGKGGQSCPPHGGKSICGRRPRMEDAYTAYPFLVKVPVPPEDCPVTERLPPRIATQHKEADVTPPGSESGASDVDEASLRARRASSHSASTTAGLGGSSAEPRVEALHFFGVFDGHGGAEAAAHCAQTLHQRIADALSAATSPSGRPRELAGLPSSPVVPSQQPDEARPIPQPSEDAASDSAGQLGDAIIEETLLKSEHGAASPPTVGQSCAERFEAALTTAFSQTDEEFGKGDKSALVGTTAVVALIGQRQMYVANCGDSRAVLCRGDIALPLTDDHKAAREDETARVEALGGQILFWNGVRVMGVLAVSRAIGDHCLRPFVIAQPEVTIVTRRAEDELLLLASDGLWDVLSNQEACTLAKRCLKRARQRGASRQAAARIAATVLTRAAIDRGSRDNVTVVVVDLTGSSGDKPEGAEGSSQDLEHNPNISS